MQEQSEHRAAVTGWRQRLGAMAGWLPGGIAHAHGRASRRELLWLTLAAVAGALLAVQAVTWWRLDDRAHERQRILDETRQALLAQTLYSATLSGAVAVGLSDPAVKDLARGLEMPPEVVQLHLAQLRMRLPVLSVQVLDRDGHSMAQDDSEPVVHNGLQVFSPYFRQAMQGQASVFAALDMGRKARSLFYMAPVRATQAAHSPVLGVVVLKTDAAALDAVINRNGLTTLLLDPHGVAFSSTRPDWRYAMTGPLTQKRIDAVRQSGLFGSYFDNGVASALPFADDSGEVRVDGGYYVVDRRRINWHDPEGDWQLVTLDKVSALMTWRDRWWVATLSFALLLLAGAMLLRLRRMGEQLRSVQQRHDVLREALHTCPLGAVLTDGDGRIVWVNPRYEQDSGYPLAALRGNKPSLVASGHTPPATYRDLWSTLMAGQRWEGVLVNRDRTGQLFEDRSVIRPVLDRAGRRIAIIGWHQRRADCVAPAAD